MPDAALVDRIAPELGQLEHPGDGKHEPRPLVLPIFRANAVPPEMRDQFASEAGLPTSDINRLVVEAIIALIEQTHTLVPNAEAAVMRQAVTENPARQRQLGVVCRSCGNPLFRVNVDVENPRVDGKQLLNALGTLNPDCPHTTKAA